MKDAHPLDRPVWNALTSHQAHLALADGPVLRIDPDYGLFVAVADFGPATLAKVATRVPADGAIAAIETEGLPVAGVETVIEPLSQMWAGSLVPAAPHGFPIQPLGGEDAPEMLSLATLTEPGPFFSRTHQLGAFVGVKQDGKLIAMAGERMRMPGFTEVSAVCTHPDHRGRGYAAALTRLVAERILARGETPFLHCYPHNLGANAVYEALGFSLRRRLTLTILSRAQIGAPGHR